MIQPKHISSRDNPLLKRLRALAHDSTAYRKYGQVWLEGDHLCRALVARSLKPAMAVISESKWPLALDGVDFSAMDVVLIPDRIMADISALESPSPVGFLFDLPSSSSLIPGKPSVVLDRVQDAGNVGSILRSAAAFGFTQVLAIKGTAALWSGKVLRSGMGAHFGLHLVEGLSEADIAELALPLVVTSSHQGAWLHQSVIPWPCAWVLGHEGQGVGQALMAQAHHFIRIAQPGGEESLNVAAAAAICLHASAPKP